MGETLTERVPITREYDNGRVVVRLDDEAFDFHIDIARAIGRDLRNAATAAADALAWAEQHGYVLDDPEEQELLEVEPGFVRWHLVPIVPVVD